MGVSDLPVGPTVSLVAAYRMAMARQAFAPPTDIDAIQIRPERSWKKALASINEDLF
jgi:hypothetical protein